MAAPEVYTAVGLMSGTSLDGIDLVAVEFTRLENRWKFTVLAAETAPFDEKWHTRLLCLPDQSAEIFAKTHIYFGHLLGKTLAGFLHKHGLSPDVVASHGQTIFHQPNQSFTFQIGDGETMVSHLPCPLVTNFRNKDVAAGGQGAPLVPFGEKWLFPDHRLFLNLGGFANITIGETAFDVGACNLILNRLAKAINEELSYDPNGEIARQGQFDQELFATLNALDFYAQNPPKSLGSEWIEARLWPLLAESKIPLMDVMHTYARHIACQIGRAFGAHAPGGGSLIATGGGVHNGFLMEHLQRELALHDIEIDQKVSPEIADFKEAIIFAFLGLTTLLGKPNTLSSVTGARENICGGSIHLPAGGWKSLLQ